MTNHERWRALIHWLRCTFPARYPVAVRSLDRIVIEGKWRDGDGPYYGSCDLTRGKFHIEVRRNMQFALRCSTVIHEWAHCLTWQGAEADTDHSNEWGIAYARIYRAYENFNWGK